LGEPGGSAAPRSCAWIAEANGKSDEALKLARLAAELEESMDKAAVTPGAVTPAREMLAELLMLEHQPKQALTEYQNVAQDCSQPLQRSLRRCQRG